VRLGKEAITEELKIRTCKHPSSELHDLPDAEPRPYFLLIFCAYDAHYVEYEREGGTYPTIILVAPNEKLQK